VACFQEDVSPGNCPFVSFAVHGQRWNKEFFQIMYSPEEIIFASKRGGHIEIMKNRPFFNSLVLLRTYIKEI